jgi:hypothetical protein
MKAVKSPCLGIGMVLLLISLSSCRGIDIPRLQAHLAESNCNQQHIHPYAPGDIPRPLHYVHPDPALTARFSLNSLNVAHAINILDSLREYVKSLAQYKTHPTLSNKVLTLELLQAIQQRIQVSSLEVSAIASEMVCEEERADQVASHLKLKQDDARTKLTVGAITVGALGAILAGFLLTQSHDGHEIEYIAIGTGILEAALGALILREQQKVEFQHSRNALKDIWEGKSTSTIFPPSIWYYLNYYDPSQPDSPSLREQIIAKWMSFGPIADANAEEKNTLIDLYFGEGGTYTAEQLKHRSDMHDQLEAHINLMKQDLKNLALEIENLLPTPQSH